MKKKLGIISGMGSPAGAWLFQRITELSKVKNDQEYLEIIVHNNSKIPDRTAAILHNGPSPLPELKRSVQLLNDCQADVIVMACMTAHYYYKDLVKSGNCEILHPVTMVIEELSANSRYLGKKNIGLIGSSGLLSSGIFHDLLEPLGYHLFTLTNEEQEEYFMKPIYQSVKLGRTDKEISSQFMQQIGILESRGAEIILGACSEVPLIIDHSLTTPDFIDVFELLAQNVIKHCYHKEYAI